MATVGKSKKEMTTIQVEKSIAKRLQDLAKWGDTYSAVIKRLLNGNRPKEKK